MRTLKTLVALVAVITLASCGGADAPEAEAGEEATSGTVSMWIPPIAGEGEATYWEERISAFNEDYPDIEVSVEVIPWENRNERITTAIAGNQTPDVAYVLPADVPGLADLGVLADLGPVVEESADDYYESALDAMTWDGTVYGAPALMNVTTTIYNKPVFDELGITEYPETWDEVRELAPTLADADYFVTQYEGAATMTLNGSFYPLLWQAGGEILNEDQTAATFNGPEGVKALEFVKFLADNGHTPADALTTALPVETSPLGQGRVAMVFSRSTASLEQNGVAPENMVIAPPLKDVESVSYGTVGGFARFEQAESPAAADTWISWITTAEELGEFLPARSALSPRPSMEGLYADDPLLSAQEAILDRMTTGLNHPKATEVMDLIKPHLQQALLGEVDAQTALDAAAADVDAALQR